MPTAWDDARLTGVVVGWLHLPSWSPLRDYQSSDEERKAQTAQIQKLEAELDALQARRAELARIRASPSTPPTS